MKSDVIVYEKIYRILKYKIESGLLPEGGSLPSRASLCAEYGVSEKTVRKALELLAGDGVIVTEQRKRPVVNASGGIAAEERIRSLESADGAAANDILKTGILLCYPLIANGISLCRGGDWSIPAAIVKNMNVDEPSAFWRQSNKFWHFFIARNGNELALRAVESLGFGDIDPLSGEREVRSRYLCSLHEFLDVIEQGGSGEEVAFDDLSGLYGFVRNTEKDAPTYSVPSGSPLRAGTAGLEKRLSGAQERYSGICMDIMGLIAVGRYKPGDRLPSSAEMRSYYGVSVDTVSKAVAVLRDRGIVKTRRGKGIYAAVSLDELKKIDFPPDLLAGHVRRYLDSLELLSLTCEGVAAHAAEHISPDAAARAAAEMQTLWNYDYLYQLAPRVLLKLITDNIRYGAMREIYRLIRRNYRIGRSVPRLVMPGKSAENGKIQALSVSAVDRLTRGDRRGFVSAAGEVFDYTRNLIIGECRRLGYYDAAMLVYDGAKLWK